jgi:hypothetical protein
LRWRSRGCAHGLHADQLASIIADTVTLFDGLIRGLGIKQLE